MNFLEYIKRPITSRDVIESVKRSVAENEEIITEIQHDQWSEGKDKEGNVIGRYKPFTESVSKEPPFPNKPKIAGQPYNLDWSGDLKRRTFVKTRDIGNDVLVQIDSRGSSLLELFETIEKHGLISNPNTIFGYQPKNLNSVTRVITKSSLKILKSKTNGMRNI